MKPRTPAELGLPALYTPNEVADALRVTPRTVRNMIHRGDLPAIQLSPRTFRVRASEVAAYVEQSTEQPRRGRGALAQPNVEGRAAVTGYVPESAILDGSVSPQEAVEWLELAGALHDAMGELSDRERAVLAGRFATPRRTLSEIGEGLGVSKERVRQMENLALGYLARTLDAAGWGRDAERENTALLVRRGMRREAWFRAGRVLAPRLGWAVWVDV